MVDSRVVDQRTLVVTVLGRERERWAGRARQVVVPGTAGGIGVLPGRQPVVAMLRAGDVRIQDISGAWHVIAIAGGFATVTGGGVEILDCEVRTLGRCPSSTSATER